MANYTYINDSDFYNPNDYGWDILEAFAFPPGRYFLGDPCHALTEDQYREACNISYNDTGVIEGVGRVAIFKCPGDGQYFDEDGSCYIVSSGTLGVVPIRSISSDEISRLSSFGKVLEVAGDSENSNWEEEGDGFQAMIDSQGHIYLGSAWIFCGEEHPLKAEFWRFQVENELNECDFWPDEVNKVKKGESAFYYGWCESDNTKKCFIINASLAQPTLLLGPNREYARHSERLPGYTHPDFEDEWIELAMCKGMSAVA